MLKRLKILLVLIFMIMAEAGCETANNTYQGNVPEDIRRIFVGTWHGEHIDDEGKLSRTWIQNRSQDGTYTITFVHHRAGGAQVSKQKGKWWIDGDTFCEIAPDVMEAPDVYRFEILSDDEIRFKSIVNEYEFIDRRIPDLWDGTFI